MADMAVPYFYVFERIFGSVYTGIFSCARKGENRMFGKRRKGAVLLLAAVLVFASLQGCKKPEENGKKPETTATPQVNKKDEKDETPASENKPVTPTVAPGNEEDNTQSKVQQKLPEYTVTVGNELYFEFAYEYEALIFRSENPDIVQASFMEGEYDWEEERETTGVMLYGIANGETELVVTDVRNGQEARWKVTVEKPEAESGKQRLIDWLLAGGETNDLGDKVLTKGTPESGGQATVEYATMDENINFYYKEVQDEMKIEWNLIPTEKENTEYYITMRMGEEFVTATVDLATYTGGSIAFEQGWFRIPAEEAVQQSANEISKRAYEEVRELLEKETGMTMGEVVR